MSMRRFNHGTVAISLRKLIPPVGQSAASKSTKEQQRNEPSVHPRGRRTQHRKGRRMGQRGTRHQAALLGQG